MEPHISLAAEKITEILGFPLTNSLLTTYLVGGILLGGGYFAARNAKVIPGSLQNFAEMVIEALTSLFAGIHKERVHLFFPLCATIFLFVIAGNWFGLLPGVGSIGIFKEGHPFTPLFRGPTADLNTTLGLAIVAVLGIQYFGFKTLGKSYLTRFINLAHPISFFVGILEIFSETSRIISFAFRLFGNIFAGEVLLTIVAFLLPLLAPLPFLGLEIFVGFIQALIFSMLTAVFLQVATSET